ncbi:MAG: ABC transporter substrate-binding protein [Caldilinea sp. CFX5]|nr:ABC transporter substrate-binding protein [Caldilinea sp. CFX5]
MATSNMRQRVQTLFSFLAVLALVLVACAPAPTGDQAAQPAEPAAAEAPAAGSKILLYGGNQDIDNIDPATGENYSINAALISLYDALFITRGNELQPNLVESYEVSDDAKVFTFKLKQNAKFHDGSPVNAEAVVYSFNRLMTLQGPPTYRWAGIATADAAKVVDEFTVEFTLEQPFAPFVGTLTQLYIVNPAVVEANKGDDFGQTYLKTNSAGSGPFTQGRWEIGNLYEFNAVADYWGGWKSENHIDGFLWIIKRDSASQVNSLLAGETHIADTIDGQDAEKIQQNPGFVVYENSGYFINTLKMNTQAEYTSDINVRKAIAYALNYEQLPVVQDIPVQVLPGPTPLNFIGAVQDLEVPTYDIAKAKEYLAKSPWPDGGFTLDYVYVTDLTREEVTGLLLLEGLKELNITLNMKPMLWPDMVASCATPETGPALINIYTQPSYLDPDAHLYNQYHSGQWGSFNSCSFYKNEEVDKLLDEARVLGDEAQRMEKYAEAQRLIAADQPAVWTYTENTMIAAHECIKGYEFRPLESLSVLFQDLAMENCPG